MEMTRNMGTFEALDVNEQLVIDGGSILSEVGDWVIHFCNITGKAAHDAFGCWKCGLHFF